MINKILNKIRHHRRNKRPKLINLLAQETNKQSVASLSVIAEEQTAIAPIDEPASQVDQRLAISSVALGLAVVGGFGYPLLGLMSIFPILLIVVPILREAYKEFREKESISERVTMTTVDGVLILGTLGMGACYSIYRSNI